MDVHTTVLTSETGFDSPRGYAMHIECQKCGALNGRTQQRCWDCGRLFHGHDDDVRRGRETASLHSSDGYRGTGALQPHPIGDETDGEVQDA
jgi:hypothetical protein